MDDAVKQAFDFSKYQRVFQNQRDLLKIKTQSRLQIGYNGGMFSIGPELLFLVKTLIDDGKGRHPLVDNNFNPIMIENLEDFFTDILGRYTEVLNEYYAEYEKLKKARDTRTLVDV